MLLDHFKDVLQPAIANHRESLIEELLGLIGSIEAVEEQLCSSETHREVARTLIVTLLDLDAACLDGDSVLGPGDEEEYLTMFDTGTIQAHIVECK